MKNAKTNWPLTALLVILAPLWVPLLILFLLLLAIVIPMTHLVLYIVIWCFWLPRGKDVLFIYSNSPIWQEYMLSEMLPLVKNRAFILNWSERNLWKRWSLSVLAFRRWGGDKAFNPLILVFRPFRRVETFRFWPAFREWKQGNTVAVDQLKREVARSLSLAS